MGGGKTIDTAKIAADRAGIPVIVVPTIASTDAPTSGCAVIYSKDGVFDSVCYQRLNPAAVLVDVGIIAAAPTRFLVAGMGDALATWFEARSCERTQSANECGGSGTAAGLAIARLCYETLLSHGVAAKLASERHLVTPALERIVEANILLSGIGFESAGLAAAHSIHNGLTALAETHSSYHGEKVAFGTLAGLQLTDASAAETATVFSFCEDVGLPTTLADIGLGKADRRQLMEVAEKACAPGQPIHHEAGVITPARVLDAMLAADAFGQERKDRGGSQRETDALRPGRGDRETVEAHRSAPTSDTECVVGCDQPSSFGPDATRPSSPGCTRCACLRRPGQNCRAIDAKVAAAFAAILADDAVFQS